MAPRVGIPSGLGPRHWEDIRFIREEYRQSGECPLVFTTCRAMHLSLRDMEALFPSGYLRGACRLAGVTYRDRFVDYFGERATAPSLRGEPLPGVESTPAKTYRVDVLGVLVEPGEWDEEYAAQKAREMKVPGGLTPEHLEVLHYLRERFRKTGAVPTVLECCNANGLELAFVWLATSDLKDLYVEKRRKKMVPFLEIIADLLSKGVKVRLIHAKKPGPAFQEDFDRYPGGGRIGAASLPPHTFQDRGG